MRIGIDACCWSNERGFGRFTRELVTEMAAVCVQNRKHELVLVADRFTAARCEFPDGVSLQTVATSQQPTSAAAAEGSRSLLDLWRMRRATSRADLDVFFYPAVYTFFPVPKGVPSLVTLHDAIAENFSTLIFPNRRSRILWNLKMRTALRQARMVLTVSRSARQQIIQTFHYPESRIRVTNEGAGGDFRPIHDREAVLGVLDRYALPRQVPLLLYVGGISPHKNIAGLLRAVALLRETKTAGHLVLVGDHENDSFYGCYDELVHLVGRLGIQDRVTFTGFVPNDDLAAIYNGATLVVLPSFSEGFGLPVLEAMACGVPVAASRRDSIPEVLGSAGVLFDPTDDEDVAAALRRLLDDSRLRKRLAVEGLERAMQFTWKAAAGKVLQVLEEVGREPESTS